MKCLISDLSTAKNERGMQAPLPPIAQIRKPKFVMPPLACNTHCHVFGPADIFPYAEGRKYTPPDAPKQALAAMHKALGVTRAVVVQATCHGSDNSAMLDAIASSGGAYRGVAIADENFDDVQAEALHRAGVRGIRFSFLKSLGETPDLALIRRVADQVKGLGWHIVFLLSAEEIPEYFEMLASLPLPFVIDHMGRVSAALGLEHPSVKTMLDLMTLENAWVKISGVERMSTEGAPFTDTVPFAAALIQQAPNRVLWGTDWPHPNVFKNMPNDGDLVDLIPLYAPNETVQHSLLVANPARLYGFEASLER